MARAAVLIACALLSGAAPSLERGHATPTTSRAEFTLSLQRLYQPGNRTTKFRFFGRIPVARGGEYVAVLRKPCGSPNATALAGATTRADGAWEAESQGYGVEYDSSTYWARWESQQSDPLVFRGRAPLGLTPLGRSRYRVTVSTTAQSMKGKRIELQRFVGGGWSRVSFATLAGRGSQFSATVVAKGQNVRYRVFVSAAAARPCYSATASEPFITGRSPSPGSSNVIDRTLLCATEVTGGLRMISVRASSARSAPPTAVASVGVTTNFVPDWTLASAHAAAMEFNPKRCSSAQARPALTPKGLGGRAVTSAGVQYDCETPTEVLIRLRASFREPAKLEPDRTFGYLMQQARGEVLAASLVVTTLTRRRLAFASFANGKGRLHTATSCTEDD
jgi:hypothetical protein